MSAPAHAAMPAARGALPGEPAGGSGAGSGGGAERAVLAVRGVRRGVARRRACVLGGLSLVLLALVLVRSLLSTYRVSLVDALRILQGEQIPVASFVLMESTLPRALMATVAGMAFGASGAAFQHMLRNPLASPDVLGVSLGASAAAVFAVVLLGASGTTVSIAAFAGAALVAALLHLLAGRGGGVTGRMILVGIGLSALLTSLVHWVLLRADIYRAQDALVWLNGSLTSVTWSQIGRLAAVVVVVLPLAVLAGRRLDVLALGDDAAAGLGLAVTRMRLLTTTAVVLLTATATSVVGPIAFVAFLSGPIARRLRGRPSVATGALVGACLTVLADHLAALVVPGTPLPVGVVTGAAGAPVLLWLLVSSRRTASEA